MSRNALRVSAAFLLLLAITLGPKLWLTGRITMPNDVALAAQLAERLHRIGLSVAMVQRIQGMTVVGTAGACTIAMRGGDNAHAFAAIFENWARATGPLQYAYRGRLTSEPPALRSKAEALIQGQLAAMSIAMRRPAVIALARSSGCGAAMPDLRDIDIVPVLADPNA